MAKEEDRKKLQKLRDEIEALKHEGLDHQHPKFKQWQREVRTILKELYGDGSVSLKRFERLQFRRRGDRMWGEDYDIGGKERIYFKEDLERARVILDEALQGSPWRDKESKKIGEEEFIDSVERGRLHEAAPPVADQAPAEEIGEMERGDKIEELLRGLEKDKRDLEMVEAILQEAMEEAQLIHKEEKERRSAVAAHPPHEVSAEEVTEMEGKERLKELLQQLEKEIKDPSVELRKVQSTMEELLKVKRKDAILQRLIQEARDPKAPWGKIKGLMKGVWEADKKLLVDILSELLES